jgi:hypothetical protein
MKAVEPVEQPGAPDFSGYWRQIKNENMDQYLKVPSRTTQNAQHQHISVANFVQVG